MGFESKRSLEIEFEEMKKQLDVAFKKWNVNRTPENEIILNDLKEYIGQVAYKIQRCNMHEKLVDNGYEFDSDDEDIVIEYASMWSADLLEVAEAMENGDLRVLSFDEYVEEYVVDSYKSRAGSEGVEILREFERWLSTGDFKDFVRSYFTDGEENIVECFENDYIIIMI